MERPILFNTEMVLAILDGRKTQTRMIIRKKYDNTEFVMFTNKYGTRLVERQNDAPPPRKYTDENGVRHTVTHMVAIRELDPPCKKWDILWVRETWRSAKGIMYTYINGEVSESSDWHDGFEYRAGGYHFPDGFKESNDYFHLSEIRSEGNWHPSIHMPREAARIFLRVKDVRTERLQDMNEEAAIAEGFADPPAGMDSPLERFAALWDKTVKRDDLREYGYHANPWVWVIEFERIKPGTEETP